MRWLVVLQVLFLSLNCSLVNGGFMEIYNPSSDDQLKERNGDYLQPEITDASTLDEAKTQDGLVAWKQRDADEYYVPNFIRSNDGQFLKFKMIDIGDWNMDSTQFKAVSHGVTGANIVMVFGKIFNDTNTKTTVMTPAYNNTVNAATIYEIGATSILLYRDTGGIYDNANYNSTGYNRGELCIIYTES